MNFWKWFIFPFPYWSRIFSYLVTCLKYGHLVITLYHTLCIHNLCTFLKGGRERTVWPKKYNVLIWTCFHIWIMGKQMLFTELNKKILWCRDKTCQSPQYFIIFFPKCIPIPKRYIMQKEDDFWFTFPIVRIVRINKTDRQPGHYTRLGKVVFQHQ